MSRLIQINPAGLLIHPEVAAFPRLGPEAFKALRESIRLQGVQKPIVLDDAQFVVDGRHRVEIAADLGIEMIAAEVRPMPFPKTYALESALQGRQLTKLGRALLLFEQHPQLASRKGLKTGGAKQLADHPPVNSQELSFRDLGLQYSVDRDYFTLLVTVQKDCRPQTRDWEMVCEWVYQKEIGPTRLTAALGGWQKNAVGDEADELSGKRETNHLVVWCRAMRQVRDHMLVWETLDERKRAEMRSVFLEIAEVLPPELRQCLHSKGDKVA